TVARILEIIGRDGIFAEYTRHDISHINKLLEMLDWLVPPATLHKMTTGDCLMVTLAIYFHDLGMAVTRDEFDRRNESAFPEFREKVLFGGSEGADYREKASRMTTDQAERFLYQEFVREHHAERIRAWVVGKAPKRLGAADKVAQELEKLLDGLGEKFRRDLGIVCESHHLDDLGNLEKYKPSQPYGSSPEETVNLQYSALLLRTADLLHVTKDRAPSVSFRVINPSDPKSIEEWHKQMAVTTVRPKPGLDKEGNVDPTAPTDTVEVHGYFTEPEGFFSLTAYLSYARKELQRSNEWAQTARKKKGSAYEFPWRDIDDSNCEAEGFINKQFEFTLDQAKVLDLLTGHRLYNDTTVVLRELVQNSLDAIRLQWEGVTGLIEDGEVRIIWDTRERSLTVEDNGTGMTQDTIDKHFLKVGSSLYQDDNFKKQHPEFSAISKFGIGVLSTFMVSDDVEVTTCHPDDDQSRRLSLRNLHGKYLIRLLDKESAGLPPQILPHGTQVKLKVRSSADLEDVLDVVRRWILFPRCRVTVSVDGASPVRVGFADPQAALRDALPESAVAVDKNLETVPKQGDVRIEQKSKGGVTVAYALRWSSYFREWEFLPTHLYLQQNGTTKFAGTCIEGVRVDFASPGFEQGYPVLAMANSVGQAAPKTNVARLGIEATAERKLLMSNIYGIYCQYIAGEIEALQKERCFSLTWALGEAPWLMAPLFADHTGGRNTRPVDVDALLKAFADVPFVALEEDGLRSGLSAHQLSKRAFFWTVDSAFFESAEKLIREVPTATAISKLSGGLGAGAFQMPQGPYLAAPPRHRIGQQLIFGQSEVDGIVIRRDQRRLDMRWAKKSNPPRWHEAMPLGSDLRDLGQRIFLELRGRENVEVYVARGAVE
ncbi:MAG: ATP-binding protein, partial [Nitrososphaerales archaeon]